MKICGLWFSKSTISYVNSTTEADPTVSRLKLSRMVCERNDWRTAKGNLKDAQCRKALLELDRREVIRLPLRDKLCGFEQPASGDSPTMDVTVSEVRCSLAELGEISCRLITGGSPEDSRYWNGLIDNYHYVGSSLCGAQARYLIESSVFGCVGAFAFTSGTWALKDRDKYIGWTKAARVENVQKVVCNSRFLVPRPVRVPNLCSHAISLVLSRLPDDWEQLYGIRPVLMETFVDPVFSGAAYRASNWQHVGYSSGRRDGTRKMVYVYPLAPNWREILCQEPVVELGTMPRPESPASWAEEEFGSARFYDQRLTNRLCLIAEDFYNRPNRSIPDACEGSVAKTVGAYRFFANKDVSMQVVLTAHLEATVERINEHRLVLAPQDTTTLDYNTHHSTEGLGPTAKKGSGGLGLIMHDTLAFTEEGTPLGVLDAQCWARDPDETEQEKKKRRKGPIEGKESMKWLNSYRKAAKVQELCPNTTIVSIGDREADIYELFLEASNTPSGPPLLVRSEKSRKRETGEEQLWDYMTNRPVDCMLEINIPKAGSRPARRAVVELRFAEIELTPPERLKSSPNIKAWAVHLIEKTNDPTVKEPIEWMLTTTFSVETVEDAKRVVDWYSKRWGIEVYHRVLKTGCRIRDHQLDTREKLEACIAVDMVVAWRLFHLTMLGREIPDASCEVFFNDIEWQTLCSLVKPESFSPNDPPTLLEAIRMLGKLGGHLGRKGDGLPGTEVLWRGLERLDMAVAAIDVLIKHKSVREWVNSRAEPP